MSPWRPLQESRTFTQQVFPLCLWGLCCCSGGTVWVQLPQSVASSPAWLCPETPSARWRASCRVQCGRQGRGLDSQLGIALWQQRLWEASGLQLLPHPPVSSHRETLPTGGQRRDRLKYRAGLLPKAHPPPHHPTWAFLGASGPGSLESPRSQPSWGESGCPPW